MKTRITDLYSRTDLRSIRLLLMLISLVLFVLGAGAPIDFGGMDGFALP